MKTKPKVKLIRKIGSLAELRTLAEGDDRYEALAMIAARNLGGSPKGLEGAMRWLEINAQETTEEGVVDEVNFCRDLRR